ncbi:MAG: ABC transporter ATP-binding protein [Comamonadaceae bacterium]|nr:MAG: ABC transporter ATP-binding protein [Comamonadaceae bacterium]
MPEPVDAPVLALDGLRVQAGGRTLLDGVSLQVPPRGLLGIVGPNGAGKSSLLRAALDLLPLQAGQVQLDGRALAQWTPRERAARIGYVPQQAHSHWDLTVQELLSLQRPRHADWLPQLIEACELDALLGRRFATLSGGEKARASLARALVHEPALLLADEPAAHLDIPHHHRLMAMLRAQSASRAVVVVLHDLHVASRHCDRLVLMAEGRVLADGTPAQVLEPARLQQAFGAPVSVHEAGAWRFFSAGEEAAP